MAAFSSGGSTWAEKPADHTAVHLGDNTEHAITGFSDLVLGQLGYAFGGGHLEMLCVKFGVVGGCV